ncbi:MAG: aminotransferase class I/II-fold pyridoxal phosphate-dependent enzyme [Planctomycetota bacterium]
MLDLPKLLSDRATSIQSSGIRRVFELGATLKNPVNLSIGQPDFDVPRPMREGAINAIEAGHNGYAMTTGVPALVRRCGEHLHHDLGWPADTGSPGADTRVLITGGTAGALFLVMQALLDPGDEIVLPDPYFVAYPNMARCAGGVSVFCDTYPDMRMTAERVEPLITERTKAVLSVSPSNPSGVVASQRECDELLELCRSKGVLLISDEIYDEFTFDAHRVDTPSGRRCPSPARVAGAHEDVLVVRGFGKTYACTGWRMGFCAGPSDLVMEMTKLQQYSWVCAPTPFQHACVDAFDCDMTSTVAQYAERAQTVVDALPNCEIPTPGGAFYAFVKVPERLGMTGTELFEAAAERNVLVIPGGAFSQRDTHIRLSFATDEERLAEGLGVLADLTK